MCIGTLLLGALLLAGCTLAGVGVLERGVRGWRRVLLVGYAGGTLLGVVAVFSAFAPAVTRAAPPLELRVAGCQPESASVLGQMLTALQGRMPDSAQG